MTDQNGPVKVRRIQRRSVAQIGTTANTVEETASTKSISLSEKFHHLFHYTSLVLKNEGPVARDHVSMISAAS